MKNAPITTKVLVAVLALTIFGFGVMEINGALNRALEVRSAKKWCEEYASIMLDQSRPDMDGLPDYESIARTIGWSPRVFMGPLEVSAYVEAGVAKVNFESHAGYYSYSSTEGWKKTSNRMPIMVGADGGDT